MSNKKPTTQLIPFDASRYLHDDVVAAEYMTAALESDDLEFLLSVLNDIARARGMAQVAREAGLGRESLYKALSPGAQPRFDTIAKVVRALGMRLSARIV
jgi:probable addiction module antidote protein